MKKIFLLICLSLLYAHSPLLAYPNNCHSKLSDLKRELEHANEALQEAQKRVQLLEESIALKEISLIEQEICKAKESPTLSSWENFLSPQREKLTTIIQRHPTCALKAQTVLDQILTLITQLSDESLD